MQILQYILGIVTLVCMILVAIKVFQNSGAGMGILFIVLIFVTCGIGPFIWGWVKSSEYDVKTVMLAWTVCWVISIILTVVSGGPAIPTH